MPVLLFILLVITYLSLFKNKMNLAYIAFTLFVLLWIAGFVPHTVHYVNIQL